MATFKFYKIGEANAEITRLEGEVTRLEVELNSANSNANEIAADAQATQKEFDEAKTELAAVKQRATPDADQAEKVKMLTEENEKLKTELKALQDTINSPDGEIETRSAAKAQHIAAGQGIPPLRQNADKSANKGDLAAQLAAITDPIQRTLFFRKNKAEIRSARLS